MIESTREETPPAALQDELAGEVAEPLQELRWAWHLPLEVVHDPTRRGSWLLNQGRCPVVEIAPMSVGCWSVRTAAEEWTAAVRRRRRRLGWHLEIAGTRELDPVLRYRPHNFVLGGDLAGADDKRYELRGPLLLRADWTLGAARGRRLASITGWTKPPPEAAGARAVRSGLVLGASREPDLLLLLAVASVAIVIHLEQPVCGGGCC